MLEPVPQYAEVRGLHDLLQSLDTLLVELLLVYLAVFPAEFKLPSKIRSATDLLRVDRRLFDAVPCIALAHEACHYQGAKSCQERGMSS